MSLLLKKSWHPALMKNQARVYEAEQAEIAERKKTAARLQEIKEERAKEELQSELEKAGGKARLNRVDWMYEGPSNGQAGTSEELEGFLLGKRRIDNLLTRGSEQESLKKPVGPGLDTAVAPKLNERDTAAKLREDPLLAIKRKEQEAYEAMVSDPIRRQQLLASMGKTEERHSRKKDDKHSRKHRHRSHSREHRHRRHRRSDSRDRDSERRHRHRRSDSRDRSTSRDRYESRKSRHHERSGRGRSESPERSRDHDRSRRERSRSPRRSGHDDHEERPSRRHDNSEDAPRGRRRYDSNNDNEDRRDARGGRYNDRRRNDRYGGNSSGSGSGRAPSNATADAEEKARKLAAMQANASDLDQDRSKRLAALEEKERQAREADDKARERSGKYGDKEFVHGLRRQLIK